MRQPVSIAIAIGTMLALAGCSGPPPGAAAIPATSAEVGARLYEQNCVPCHREDGNGLPGVYPSLAGSSVVNGAPRELALWVLNGEAPQAMAAGRYATRMPKFGWMRDQDAAALFTFIRSHFGNSSPPVDTLLVAQARP